MASKPFFSAEFGTVSQTATLDIVRNGGAAVPVSFTIAADQYFIGASTASRSLAQTIVTALNAAAGIGPFQFNVLAASDNLGLACSLSYDDSTTPGALTSLVINNLNAVAQDALWAIGFRNVTSLTFTVVGESAAALTTGIPRYTWFPKAFVVDQDNYTTVAQQARSSRLTGSGSLVSSVRQDDGDVRWWRSWRMTQVAAARCSYPKATSTATPQWAIIAGLTTNPGDAALDKEDGWWQRTCAGQYRFVAIEDEADATTPTWDVYRVVDDDDQPTGMGGWKNLRAPNVVVYSTAGATRSVELCAIASRVGNT